jgi:hypothetical protein
MASITSATIIKGEHVIQAWRWFLQNLSYRPSKNSPYEFIFDNKVWKCTNYSCLSSNDPIATDNIHKLYITSQFSGDSNDLVEISMGVLKDSIIRTPKIEDGVIKILQDKDSFRYSLSENLAYWLQLATLAQANLVSKYVVSLPNASPRDPGPDGLSISIDKDLSDVVEIRSVKSAKGRNPKPMIVSTQFAEGGEADPTKQLDEFYLICAGEHGFIKFDRLLTDAFYRMGRKAQDEYRAALIQKHSKLNAVVVADHRFAAPEIFSSYARIPRLPTERIATFIGVDDWDAFSNDIQSKVLATLKSFGVI